MEYRNTYSENSGRIIEFSKLVFIILSFALTNISQSQAQVYPDIVRYMTSTTPVNGLKIKTNIPFVAASDMVSLEIKGYSYGITSALDLHLCFYIYYNANGPYVYYPVISSSGAHTPDIKIANENNLVVIYFTDKVYHQKIFVNAFSGMNKPVTYYQGWTIVDEPFTGTMVADAIYKNSFRGEITLPGGKWTSAGNVGIGTDAPTEKLSVKGKIRAQEIKVETANWPDYVFAESYQLPTLKETAAFIEKNKHLPGVPKATEVEENGLSLGEMNRILLQKIEELTLHMIDKDKRIDALEKKLSGIQ
ncbi:hypothetical protein [Sphingobacterium sp. Ag1]|uniref:hypothetical protein n=1 Tax=Sphingobacterium sp. Ag1 TaxID=1643451 RepID=UPI00069B36E3|nr:hypothetical protein [Sphingobacterium sp. Ag1]